MQGRSYRHRLRDRPDSHSSKPVIKIDLERVLPLLLAQELAWERVPVQASGLESGQVRAPELEPVLAWALELVLAQE